MAPDHRIGCRAGRLVPEFADILPTYAGSAAFRARFVFRSAQQILTGEPLFQLSRSNRCTRLSVLNRPGRSNRTMAACSLSSGGQGHAGNGPGIRWAGCCEGTRLRMRPCPRGSKPSLSGRLPTFTNSCARMTGILQKSNGTILMLREMEIAIALMEPTASSHSAGSSGRAGGAANWTQHCFGFTADRLSGCSFPFCGYVKYVMMRSNVQPFRGNSWHSRLPP